MNEATAKPQPFFLYLAYNAPHSPLQAKEEDLSDQYPERLREMVSQAEKWSRGHTEPRWFDEVKVGRSWKATGMPNFESTFQIHSPAAGK